MDVYKKGCRLKSSRLACYSFYLKFFFWFSISVWKAFWRDWLHSEGLVQWNFWAWHGGHMQHPDFSLQLCSRWWPWHHWECLGTIPELPGIYTAELEVLCSGPAKDKPKKMEWYLGTALFTYFLDTSVLKFHSLLAAMPQGAACLWKHQLVHLRERDPSERSEL